MFRTYTAYSKRDKAQLYLVSPYFKLAHTKASTKNTFSSCDMFEVLLPKNLKLIIEKLEIVEFLKSLEDDSYLPGSYCFSRYSSILLNYYRSKTNV